MEYEEIEFVEEDKIKRITINQIEPIKFVSPSYVSFENALMPSALQSVGTDVPEIFQNKLIELSPDTDWVIRKYDDGVYLIALKKDC